MFKIFFIVFLLFTPNKILAQNALSCGTPPAEICKPDRLKVRPQCINGNWDFDEQLCGLKGRTEICGGKNYCCPVAGGSWTTDMSSCKTNSPTPTSKPRIKGDANGDGKIDILDYAIWHKEFFDKVGLKSDFSGPLGHPDGKVNIYDYSLWHQRFYQTLR